MPSFAAAIKVTTERANAEGTRSRWQGLREMYMNDEICGPAGAIASRAKSQKD